MIDRDNARIASVRSLAVSAPAPSLSSHHPFAIVSLLYSSGRGAMFAIHAIISAVPRTISIVKRRDNRRRAFARVGFIINPRL